jgi:hypothetical protein
MPARLLALAAVIAVSVALPATATAKRVVGYVFRDQPVKAKFVKASLAKAFPNDPYRCEAHGFVQWPRVKYATRYTATIDPPPEYRHLVGRQTRQETDNALFDLEDGPGLRRRSNPAPARKYETSLGTVRWGSGVARAHVNSYSVGTGCDDAEAGLAEWAIVKPMAKLSVPVQRIVPDDPTPPRDVINRAPKGAVAMVIEVDGGQMFRRRDGKTRRTRPRDFVQPGDVIWLEGKGQAAIEFITGGRAGFVGDRAILVLSGSQVKDVTSGPAYERPLKKALAVWKKMSQRTEPLEVETAGGVMGIKG